MAIHVWHKLQFRSPGEVKVHTLIIMMYSSVCWTAGRNVNDLQLCSGLRARTFSLLAMSALESCPAVPRLADDQVVEKPLHLDTEGALTKVASLSSTPTQTDGRLWLCPSYWFSVHSYLRCCLRHNWAFLLAENRTKRAREWRKHVKGVKREEVNIKNSRSQQ